MERDYSSISPSAKSLLLLKGHTDIPFAREAAAFYSQSFIPDFSNAEFSFWARVLHFESRYKSINQLMADIDVPNILELSSGFSFRGLDLVCSKDVHYIDTDLPGIIDIKKEFVNNIEYNKCKGTLETLPLNALDEQAFKSVVDRFENGTILFLNEGLLVYLNIAEKERLCRMIYDVLKRRGGYWITADIYVRTEEEMAPELKVNDKLAEFFEKHHIRDNMFDSFDTAEKFFHDMGFVIDKVANDNHAELTSLPHFMKLVTPERLAALQKMKKPQATWRLKVGN